MTACDRFEREHLADLLGDELSRPAGAVPVDPAPAAELAAHVETCADCRAQRARYERIARAFGELGTSARRAPDHVARVLATVGPPRRMPARWLRRAAPVIGPLLAAAAAVALVWWLRREGEPAPRLALEIIRQEKRVLRGDAHLGDRLRVTASPGAALWIYRNDRELLRVCPRDCGRDGDRLVAELDLDSVGRYQVVWLSTDRVPAPAGDLERDIAAAHAAGATHELRDLDVQ